MSGSSSFHGSTTSSSDLNSHTMSKIRTIRLNRPHTGNKNNLTFGHPPFSSFGFSLRGGREYGTGFFVSNVVKGSEADLKGLQVGDQIVRIGGSTGNYRVDDAVHKELSQFIINQDRLLLKVRGVGIIPIKETQSGNLTWHVVPLNSNSSMIFDHNDNPMTQKEIRIVLNVAPRTKLGCGICKGPDWKPGIFVQFTKENGIAREAGLRPGDQILSCNGISFNSDILFSEAVSIMKNSEVLELFVRTQVGLDLFPGESSGYNSSASSITGDQSPCWGEAAKRLSIVREESTSSSDRLHPNLRFRDRRKEKPIPVGVPKIPKSHQNTTIIKLSEDGTTINNTMIPNSVKKREINSVYEEISNQKEKDDDQNKIANICFVSKQNETKIVTVEVHRSSSTNIAPPPPQFSQESSVNSPPEQSSLSSAISEELRRRELKKLKQPSEQLQPQPSSISEKTNSPKGMGGQIHNILMDEFKKAHQKMFKNGFVENQQSSNSNDRTVVANVEERQLEKREISKFLQNDSSPNDAEIKTNFKELPMKKKAPPPPPTKKLEKQVSELTNIVEPTPDYDSPDNTLVKGTLAKGTMGRIAMQEAIKANGENAEALSLESFSLNLNVSAKIPPPPPIFFSSQKSIPSTMKKIQRPVSVIINSYDEKKDPGKFNFLESNGHGSLSQRNDEDMSTRLKKELEKTLSRSNLRRRSDSMDDLLKTEEEGDRNILHIRNNLKKDLKDTKLLQETQKNGLNGILKNGTKASQTKNISFGEVKQ